MLRVLAVIFSLVLMSGAALAQATGDKSAVVESGHKINMAQKLVDPNGLPYLNCERLAEDGKCTKTVEVTVGYLAIAALNASTGDPAIQILQFRLLNTIVSKTEIELSADDTKRLVDAIWQWRAGQVRKGLDVPLYSTGQAVKIIDPASLK
jgi:hypothetical protein